MKFGIFILPSWPEAETAHQGRIYHEAVEQIQYAEELGFDAVWMAEHHFTRFGIVPSCCRRSPSAPSSQRRPQPRVLPLLRLQSPTSRGLRPAAARQKSV
jgi:alkanesulfonate monooxygenase SsuD/methylene tetrahydromethanopterin reductase-like flavin-dependent oxidoreductase (luciferase family)